MAGRASPPSWRSAAARPITSACTGSCARTICFACGEVEVCCGHHELEPHPPDISESGTRHGADRNQPALGWPISLTSGWELEFRLPGGTILDVFSRRVIGWALDRTLEDRLTIAALQMAFDNRSPALCLVHHSDRVASSTPSRDYTDLLKDRRITISMSRKRKPLRQRILRIIHEDVQIRRSPPPGVPRSGRSALPSNTSWNGCTTGKAASLVRSVTGCPGGTSKAVLRRGSRTARMKTSLRFIRHGGIYRSDVSSQLADQGRRAAFWTGPAPSQKDAPEVSTLYSSSRRVPAGYSTWCSPAVPVSASPARLYPKTVPGSATMNFQRTAGSVKPSVCLSLGDNPKSRRNLSDAFL